MVRIELELWRPRFGVLFACATLLFLRIAWPADRLESGGVVYAAPRPGEGQFLLAPIQSRDVYLLNTEGLILHRWQSDHSLGMSAYLLPDGSILRGAREQPPKNFRQPGGSGGRVQRIAWDGTVLWDFLYAGDRFFSHHDIHPMPNGNVLLTAWEYKRPDEALAAGRDPSKLVEGGVWADSVVEIQPVGAEGGKIVWKWSAWDHLVQDFDPQKPNHGKPASRPERIDLNHVTRPKTADWTHVTSLDYHEKLNQIVLSVGFFNEIWVIDHSTTTEEVATSQGGRSGKGGDLLYRWGNPAAYGRGTAKDQELFWQHDARWVRPGHPGEGNILIFNNGQDRPTAPYSTIEEITPPLSPEGVYELEPNAPWGPEKSAWRYRAPRPLEFYGPRMSGVQRLPNGNTLICSGPAGILFEVEPDGTQVWQFVNPFGISRGALSRGPVPLARTTERLGPRTPFGFSRDEPDRRSAGSL